MRPRSSQRYTSIPYTFAFIITENRWKFQVLSAPGSHQKSGDEFMSNGYERIYLNLLPRLAECDLAESAGRLGLEVLPSGEVSARFCGRDYLITNAGVQHADGKPLDVNDRKEVNNCSVLAYYILSLGRGNPEGVFVPRNRVTGTKIEGQGNTADDPLVLEFGDSYEKFQTAATKLGGVYDDSSKDGGHIWNFEVLPKIPMRFVFYEADEEFPVDIQVLFDRSAPKFLGAECLSVTNDCFVHALVMTSREACEAVANKA
jgi:hypothetical protein